MSGAGQHFVGNVSFGPARSLWEEQPSLRELYDQACVGLVRAECEVEELRAEAAMLREQARILAEERNEAQEKAERYRRKTLSQDAEIAEARIQYRSTLALAEALAKTQVEMKAELAGYRDDACRESCRDKSAADGGWANI